jgi:hypothetical protein
LEDPARLDDTPTDPPFLGFGIPPNVEYAALSHGPVLEYRPFFIRGDSNDDAHTDISDAITDFEYLPLRDLVWVKHQHGKVASLRQSLRIQGLPVPAGVGCRGVWGPAGRGPPIADSSANLGLTTSSEHSLDPHQI